MRQANIPPENEFKQSRFHTANAILLSKSAVFALWTYAPPPPPGLVVFRVFTGKLTYCWALCRNASTPQTGPCASPWLSHGTPGPANPFARHASRKSHPPPHTHPHVRFCSTQVTNADGASVRADAVVARGSGGAPCAVRGTPRVLGLRRFHGRQLWLHWAPPPPLSLRAPTAEVWHWGTRTEALKCGLHA